MFYNLFMKLYFLLTSFLYNILLKILKNYIVSMYNKVLKFFM